MIDYTKYIEERTEDFTGRQWVFESINDWLGDSTNSSIFLLTGEPGSGKTAIAARLTQFSDGLVTSNGLSRLAPGFLSAYYFCSARDRRWINPHTFAESLALQLARRYPAYAKALAEKSGDRKIIVEVTQHASEVSGEMTGVVIHKLDVSGISAEDAFIRIVREPLETLLKQKQLEQVVILIDALDEALVYSQQVGIVSLVAKAADLPSAVRFILTSRRDERVENEFSEADGLFFSASEFDTRNNADVVRYVGAHLSQDDLVDQTEALNQEQKTELISEIGHKAAGNFLYVRFLLDAVATGRRDLYDLDGLPAGLDDLYYDSLDRVVKLGEAQWRSDYAPLMGILSVARQNLDLPQLVRFTGIDQDTLWQNLVDLQQFVEELLPEQENAESQYRLYHQSVADFLRKRYFKRNNRRLSNQYYVSADKWHRQIIAYYRGKATTWEEVDWNQTDEYGLLYLSTHLYSLKDDPELRYELYGLISRSFMETKLAVFQSHQSFSDDIALVIAAAEAETPVNWPQLIRGCLIAASLGSMATNVSPEVLAVLAQIGDPGSLSKARGYAALIQDREKQSEAYLLIGEAILNRGEIAKALEFLEYGLATARAISDTVRKARALLGVAQAMAQAEDREGLRRVLVTVQVIGDGGLLGGVAKAMAQVGDGEGVRQALDTAQAIAVAWERELALDGVAQALAQIGAAQEALVIANDTNSPMVRLRRSGAVVRALMQVRGRAAAIQTTRRALDSVQTFASDYHRARALLEVTQAMVLAEDIVGLHQVLSDAQAIDDIKESAAVLVGVAQAMAQVGAARAALVTARAIGLAEYREYALVTVAQTLAQLGAIQEALEAAQAIGDAKSRTYALSWVSQEMAQLGECTMAAQVAQEALVTAQKVGDAGDRARALGWVAQVMALAGRQAAATQVAQEALETAQTVGDAGDKAGALVQVVKALLQMGERTAAIQVAQQALNTSHVSGKSEARARALGEMTQALAQVGMVREASEAAQVIDDAVSRAYALSEVSQGIARSGNYSVANRVAREALAIAQTIDYWHTRDPVLIKVVQAMAQVGAVQEALEAAQAIGNAESRAKALSGVAQALAQVGECPLATQVALKALEAVHAIELPLNKAYTLSVVAQAMAQAEDREGLRRVLVTAQLIGDAEPRAYALSEVAQALAQMEDCVVAKQVVWEALEAARVIRNAITLSEVAQALAQVGECPAATQVVQEALSKAQANIDAVDRARDLSTVAQAMIRVGERAMAIQVTQEALEAVQAINFIWALSSPLSWVARAFAQVKDEKGILQVLAIAQAIGDAEAKVRALVEVAQALTTMDQQLQVYAALLAAFKCAREVGRESIFWVLEVAAVTLASIDAGKTLWRVYEEVMVVEAWWGV